MFCIECGKQLDKNLKFCTCCGSPVEQVASPKLASRTKIALHHETLERLPVSKTSPVRVETPAVATLPESVQVQSFSPRVSSGPQELQKTAPRKSISPLLIRTGIVLLLLVVLAAGLYWRSSANQKTLDKQIEQSIQTKIASDPDLSHCTIAVTSQNGVVTLAGSINRDSDRSAVSRIAGQERGVNQIVDNLVLAQASNNTSPGEHGLQETPPATGARIVQAVVQDHTTSLELPPGQVYLYGMETGGAFPSTLFGQGQYAQVVNAAGNLSAALAYGTNNENSYSTQTAYHTIGGVSIAGSWDDFNAYYGSNPQNGAHDASVSFQLTKDSLVVVFALAADQQVVNVNGIPGLRVDATGGGEWIAHAYVRAGTYTAVEYSQVAASGQDPAHMTDLLGIFVFAGGTSGGETPKSAATNGQNTSSSAGTTVQTAASTPSNQTETDGGEKRAADSSSFVTQLKSIVTRRGFEPADQQTWIIDADRNGNKLFVQRAVCKNSSDGRCQKLFIAFNGRFLGSDTYLPSWSVHDVVEDGVGRFTALYEDFSNMRQIPPATKVTYVWDGKKISASLVPPTRPTMP